MSIPFLQKTIQVLLLWLFTLLLYPGLGSSASLAVHDESFTPNITLYITLQTIQLNCWPRLSLLVNGTYPGPAIHLDPEETTWVRVYNDANVNFTMVSRFGRGARGNTDSHSIGMAFRKAPFPFRMVVRKQASGQYHRITSSTMSSALKHTKLERTSIILMLASRLSLLMDH